MRECITHHHACDCREAKFKEAKEIIRGLLKAIPNCRCEDFHHEKNDRHEWNESCPPLCRLNIRIEQAEKFLKEDL